MRSWKGVEKGGGKGLAKGNGPQLHSQLASVLPAKPSDARKHAQYLPVPSGLQELKLHISRIRMRLDNLHQLREASLLAGKTGSDVDTSEIAVLRHMLFMAETPEEAQASKTWSRVVDLRNQLTAALQKEREARARAREIQNAMDHFNEIYEELRNEQQERERSPSPEVERRDEEGMGHASGMGAPGAVPAQQAGPRLGPNRRPPRSSNMDFSRLGSLLQHLIQGRMVSGVLNSHTKACLSSGGHKAGMRGGVRETYPRNRKTVLYRLRSNSWRRLLGR